MRNIIAMTAAMAALSACSKQIPPEGVMTQAEFEYRTEQVKEQLDIMPKWYEKMPESDDAVFAVGTAQTPDLQLSVDIAILSAKTTLADRVDSRLRSQLKLFKKRLGQTDFDSNVVQEFEQATTNLVADADVAGYTVKEQNIVQNGTQYRAYVLLEYRNDLAMQIIKTRVAQNQELLAKLEANRAFEELDQKVEEVKAQELAELEIIAKNQFTLSKKCDIIMIANMSGDRMAAVRVFEGELERMKMLRRYHKDEPYTAEEKVVRRYLQERINSMTAKGYGRYDDALSERNVVLKYEET